MRGLILLLNRLEHLRFAILRETRNFPSSHERRCPHRFVYIHVEIVHTCERHFFVVDFQARVFFQRLFQGHSIVVVLKQNGIDIARPLFQRISLTLPISVWYTTLRNKGE